MKIFSVFFSMLYFMKTTNASEVPATIEASRSGAGTVQSFVVEPLEYEHLFMCSHDLMGIFKLNGTVLKANEALCKALGYEGNEIIGKLIDDFLVTTDRTEIEHIRSSLIGSETPKVMNYENHFICKDGQIKCFQWNSFILRDRFYGVAKDITLDKSREVDMEKLMVRIKKKTEFLKTIANIQLIYIKSQDNGGKPDIFEDIIPHIVHSTQSKIGYIGKICNDEEGTPYFQLTTYMDDGSSPNTHGFTIKKHPICPLLDRVLKSHAPFISADLSLDSGTHSRMLPFHVPIKTFIAIPLMWNDFPLGVLGLANHPETFDEHTTSLLEPLYLAVTHLMKDMIDKEEISKLKEKIIDQKKEETIQKAQRSFLSRVSHELRTPLGGIVMALEIYMAENRALLAASHFELLQTALNASHIMAQVIEDILDIARLEENQFRLILAPFRPAKLIKDTIDLLKISAHAKRLYLRDNIAEAVPTYLIGDEKRIRQILMNFIGNAIKFTETGGIEVVAKGEPQEDGEFLLTLQVIDTGIGIVADAIPKLSQPFFQVDPSSTRSCSGTGLGLTISKRLCEIMGGKMRIESTVGHGSLFSFTTKLRNIPLTSSTTLAIAPSAGAGIAPAAIPPATDNIVLPETLKILLAEDDKVNQALIKRMLERSGCKTLEIAENGKAAFEAVRDKEFHLVLMDGHMPILDGIQATNLIRTLPRGKREIPIIALTADAMADSAKSYIDAGMDAYLSKPVSREVLVRKILELTSGGIKK